MIKEKLTIALIGKRRFYVGLIFGLSFASLVFMFFTYAREIGRQYTLTTDLIILTEKEAFTYDLFFAAVSLTTGFGLMVWFWLSSRVSLGMRRSRINYASSYAMFWSMALLYTVSKSMLFLDSVLYALDGYDSDLSFAIDMPYLLFLLPTLFFLNIWTNIRLTYQSGRWLVTSLAAYVSLTIVFAYSSPIDMRILNKQWDKQMLPYTTMFDEEISKAKFNKIALSSEALKIVRHNSGDKVINQLEEVGARFKSAMPVSTDTIVLELMIIKKATMQMMADRNNWYDIGRHWPFVQPMYIFHQLQVNDDQMARMYLNEILGEYELVHKAITQIENQEFDALSYDQDFVANRFRAFHFHIEEWKKSKLN